MSQGSDDLQAQRLSAFHAFFSDATSLLQHTNHSNLTSQPDFRQQAENACDKRPEQATGGEKTIREAPNDDFSS
jgi:hypothetical protein